MVRKFLLPAFLAATMATGASAATFQYTEQANLNGVYESKFTYNDATERFAMSFETLTSANVDGFWVVVNDGPQPYGQGQGHLAILYSDLSSVWAYQYTGTGVRGVNSSTGNGVIQKFTNAVQSSVSGDRTTYKINLDVSGINAANIVSQVTSNAWEGIQFDNMIGTWLHPTRNTFANCTGPIETGDELNCFAGNKWIGWDQRNRHTTIIPDNRFPAVPLPAAGWMLLAGLGGIFAMKRRSA